MYTTINEDGILNNYAKEPEMYYATYPNQEQQRSYVLQAVYAALLVTTLVVVALGVS